MLKPAGVIMIPQATYQDMLMESVRKTRDALASGDPAALSSTPSPPAQSVPVLQDAAGQNYILVEPARDTPAILQKMREQNDALSKLIATQGKDPSDEFGENYFDQISKLNTERTATMALLQPPPRPIAQAITPPPPVNSDPARLAAGGFMKMSDFPPMPGSSSPNFAADFLAQMPENARLTGQAASFAQGSAGVSEAVAERTDPNQDEYGEGYFTRVCAAAAQRNSSIALPPPVPDAATSVPTPPNTEEEQAWNEGEYHESFFEARRAQVVDALEASKSVTQPLPTSMFAAPLEDAVANAAVAPPNGASEFFAMPSTMGDMRGAAFTATQSQDPAEFQALMQQMMQEKLDILNKREEVVAMLDRTLAAQEATT